MTAYAQVKGEAGPELSFTLSLKSVNHRFLDLHLRMPAETDALEMRLRRALKERLARGHIELTLSFTRSGSAALGINRELVGGYVEAFRAAAREHNLPGEPDLNAILRLPGALTSPAAAETGALDDAVLQGLEDAIRRLDQMRAEEGKGIERELRERMQHLAGATAEVEKLRSAVSRAYLDKVQTRMRELVGNHSDPERILQEAAMLAERSDIQEEIVRLKTHIQQFVALLDSGGETGKKLDFLLQEMNREANTMMSKTAGVAGEGLRITELGLAMKSEIEKSREQVQNLE